MGKALTKSELAALADQYGDLCAEISKLTDQQNELKAVFVKSKKLAINGNRFRITVSVFDKVTLVADLVRGFLTAKQIAMCSKETKVTAVKCKALVSEKARL